LASAARVFSRALHEADMNLWWYSCQDERHVLGSRRWLVSYPGFSAQSTTSSDACQYTFDNREAAYDSLPDLLSKTYLELHVGIAYPSIVVFCQTAWCLTWLYLTACTGYNTP